MREEVGIYRKKNQRDGPFGINSYTREIVKSALRYNSAMVIMVLVHAERSKVDKLITKQLKQALLLVGVRIPDHLVVSHNDIISFAEHG